MKNHVRSLPENFQSVAAIIGLEKAIELSKEFGGSTIYIPSHSTATRYSRNEKIKAEYRKGSSYSQLSRKYNLTQVMIRSIISCDS